MPHSVWQRDTDASLSTLLITYVDISSSLRSIAAAVSFGGMLCGTAVNSQIANRGGEKQDGEELRARRNSCGTKLCVWRLRVCLFLDLALLGLLWFALRCFSLLCFGLAWQANLEEKEAVWVRAGLIKFDEPMSRNTFSMSR